MAEGNGRYLHIKNWSKFQHYKARNPPWIKLHRSLLADYEFSALSDRDKCHLILIWLEAANHDGAVPNDPNYLRRRLSLKVCPDLKSFINNGWLAETLASTASTMQRREEKNREERSKPVDKSPKQPEATPEHIARQKRIAALLAEGRVEEARKL